MKLIFFLLISISVTAQNNFITADSFANSGMKGYNISLTQSYAEVTFKNLPLLKKLGADHVRGWVRIKHDAAKKYSFEYATSLKAMDSAIRQCERLGLYMILTMEILPRQDLVDWWGDSVLKAGIKKMWVDSLVRRYKDKKIIAAYDLMNEPRPNKTRGGTVKEYIEFTADIIKAIRAVDSNHVIVVEVLRNQMLGDLALRSDSAVFKRTLMNVKNLVYSPHGYSPLALTHQGITTTKRKMYPDTTGTYKANYFKNVTYWNEPYLFQKKYNAKIWVGEFSCIPWSPKNKLGEWSSTRWIKDVIAYMQSNKWSWSYHARGEYDGWLDDVPSSYYNAMNYKDAKPYPMPSGSAIRDHRTEDAPTTLVLIENFKK